MADAKRDSNSVPTLIGVSSVDNVTPTLVAVNPVNGRMLVSLSGGTGTVTSVSVATANGFSGTVATATTTPAITLTTTINAPALAGNGTAIAAATTTGSGSTVALATSPVLTTPNLGTPSAVVLTNATGTAASLTAGTVTTNANLTGVITSSGNATSIASQTGTGTKFVVDTSPTLITPNIGVATGTSLQANTLTATTNNSINLGSGSYNTIQTYAPGVAGTATLDLSKGNIHHITMPAGNITIALSNGTAGQCFIVRILQDGTGSRTVTWFTTIRWAGGSAPTLTTTASKADTLGFEITGANTYDGFVVGANI